MEWIIIGESILEAKIDVKVSLQKCRFCKRLKRGVK